VLGATGSIGANTVDILRRHRDRFAVEVLTARKDVDALAAAARDLNAKVAVIAEPTGYAALKEALADTDVVVAAGADALVEAAGRPTDLTVAAIVGAAGLAPTLAAIQGGSDIALANKECLVCAGDLFISAVRRHGVRLLPVDSEHNAIFQVLGSRDVSAVDRITLTASGGPFRDWPVNALAGATPDEAAAHPNWSMGRKISVDSSTLMNKGLEVIEAHWLFDVGPRQIDVVVHPQSIVHSMVELVDGSIIAQLGVTDMRLPIQYAFSYPDRWTAPLPPLDLTTAGRLEFEQPDTGRFPCLALAFRALEGDAGLPIVLNAANEIAVAEFLQLRLGFTSIPEVIRRSMEAYERAGTAAIAGLDDVRAVDRWAREFAAGLAGKVQSNA
jgi:1-deoxy-D-xylulose-5-phosphate reductoisomerase